MLAVAVLLAAFVCLPPACTTPGARLSVDSVETAASLRPAFRTTAYTRSDRNTIDIYLSDLPASRFMNPRDRLDDATGNLVHIHVFLVPRAGRTPIDSTACNVTVRHVVFADGAVGVYGGGGFVLPRTSFESEVFAGSVLDATLRLIRAGPGFSDRLGTATLAGRFAAQKNEPLAAAMGSRINSLIVSLPSVTAVRDDPAHPTGEPD